MAKVLITGYFSLPLSTNTAGDLMVVNTICKMLDDMDVAYDVVVEKNVIEVKHAIRLSDANVDDYTALLFTCGPLVEAPELQTIINKFQKLKKIAINVSVIDAHKNALKMFDSVIPRDSSEEVNIDLALGYPLKSTMVCGIIYVGPQQEYFNQKHNEVAEIINSVTHSMDIATVFIDTKLPYNEFGLKSIHEVHSVIQKMDFIITTRLHGSILSLMSGVPFIAIDPVPGGAKIKKQLDLIGWKYCYTADEITKDLLIETIKELLTMNRNTLDSVLEFCKKKYLIFYQETYSFIKSFLGEENA